MKNAVVNVSMNFIGVCIYGFLIFILKDFTSFFKDSSGEGLVLMFVPILISPLLILIGILKVILYKRNKIYVKRIRILNLVIFIVTPLIFCGVLFVNTKGIGDFMLVTSILCVLGLTVDWLLFSKYDRVIKV